MYTATSGLMFDTPEDAKRAAELLKALFEQAPARQASDDTDDATGEVLDGAGEIQTLNEGADGDAIHTCSVPEDSGGRL
jgi:hypothetical protein